LRRNYRRNCGCQQNDGIAEAEEWMGIGRRVKGRKRMLVAMSAHCIFSFSSIHGIS